ncbi:hypothetical protein Spla01_02738 [Streptomyces platensis]|uniref:IrrE N-terminal-like domain-containing protein n=2 Tax=Streptomyces platensis TaxID=58346 RepID=A0ABX3XUX2_STRPT|nr:hypothetical protein BG653_04064 [Streptomyces platensis]
MWWKRLPLDRRAASTLPSTRIVHSASQAGAGGAATKRSAALRKYRRRAGSSRPGVREMERRLRQELRELGIQPPLDVAALCKALGTKWGRDIELQPAPLPQPGPLGLLVETPEADVILYQEETTRLHQDHIILHEIGHMLAHHEGGSVDPDAMVPRVEPGGAHKVLRRCSYDDQKECDAELVATIILEWALVLDNVTAPLSADPSVRQVQAALGDYRGWL